MKKILIGVFFVSSFISSMDLSVSTNNKDLIFNSFESLLGKIESYQCVGDVKRSLLSNKPYVYIVNKKKYVVQCFLGGKSNRAVVVSNNYFVAQKNIAPKIHKSLHAPEFSYIIMDYINVPSLTLDQASQPEILSLIAHKSKQIAQFDAVICNPIRPNLSDEIVDFCQDLKNKNFLGLNTIVATLKSSADAIDNKIQKYKRPLVINHNDFSLRNIFYTGNDIKIIDWNTIALNYQYCDLALYSLLSCLNEKEDNHLLNKYLDNNVSSEDKKYFNRVKLLVKVCFILSCFKAATSLAGISHDKLIGKFREYARSFAEDAKKNETADFFYGFGMSQLQEFNKEYSEFECDNL